MAINNTNIPGITPGSIDGLNKTGAGNNAASPGNALNENFDWFSVSDGKATAISAQPQFSDTSTMDEMVSVMLGQLGIA